MEFEVVVDEIVDDEVVDDEIVNDEVVDSRENYKYIWTNIPHCM